MSQLRESFVNLTVTRGYGKRKGEKDLSKLTHQLYIYAIPYLWAFPPQEQIFGTTAVVPRHVRRAGRNTIDPTIKNYQWGDLTAAASKPRTAVPARRSCWTPMALSPKGPASTSASSGTASSPRRRATRCRASPARRSSNSPTRWASRPRCATFQPRAVRRRRIMAVTTAGGVTPINSLDGEAIGNGEPGPMTVEIRDRFWALMDEPARLIEPIQY